MRTISSAAASRAVTSAAPGRFIARLSALSAAALLGVSAFVLFSPAAPAQAHDQLTGVQIEASETGEATGLKLSFSDNILEVGTEIIVSDASGASVTDGGPKHSGRDVVQPLKAPLADGTYTTVWRVVSSDGHPIEGGFSFETIDGVAGEVMSLDAADDNHEATEGEAQPAEDHAAEADGAPGTEPGSAAVAPSFATFAPYIGIGAGLAAIIVIAAFIVRARKTAAARNTSQNSPEQE